MAYEKVIQIIKLISEKTYKNEVTWEKGSKSKSYRVTYPNYTIYIEESNADYIVYIVNNEGIVIEHASDVDLKNEFSDSLGLMRNLYIKARRIALGVDETLDNILKDLEK